MFDIFVVCIISTKGFVKTFLSLEDRGPDYYLLFKILDD